MPRRPRARRRGRDDFCPGRRRGAELAMAEVQTGGNAAQAEFWNSLAARGWADQHARMDQVLAPFLEALLAAASPRPGERVLDIGCGSGTTTLALASRIGPSGYALG